MHTQSIPSPVWGRLSDALSSCLAGEVFPDATDNAYWGGRCDAVFDLGYSQGFPSDGPIFHEAERIVSDLADSAEFYAPWQDAEDYAQGPIEAPYIATRALAR